jgi:peroxiredoxin
VRRTIARALIIVEDKAKVLEMEAIEKIRKAY